ncbi:hypothetical protein [Kitasatospora sp. HPMI-4]
MSLRTSHSAGPVLVWAALFGVVLAFVDQAVQRLPDAPTLHWVR